MTKVILFKFICDKCETVFDSPVLSDFDYAKFILFSKSGKYAAYLNAMEDNVFNEISDIVDKVCDNKTVPLLDKADAVQIAFAITCDFGPGDEGFSIGNKPACPNCGCQKASCMGRREPVTWQEIPGVTHEEWNKLNYEEKYAKIDNFLRSLT